VSDEAPISPESKRRIVCGWIVTGLGFIGILWGVFHLTSATIGGPIYQFKDRRTYNEVKKAAHEVFPGALLRALGGLALVWWGGRIRASALASRSSNGTSHDADSRMNSSANLSANPNAHPDASPGASPGANTGSDHGAKTDTRSEPLPDEPREDR
jgi:hypothetical protein